MSTRRVVAHISDNYTGHASSAALIATVAEAVIEGAGAAGGPDEVQRLAVYGWPANRALDMSALASEDEPALRGAIQYAAMVQMADGTRERVAGKLREAGK